MRDPIAEFQNFNRAFALRNPDLLRLKVARMAASPFAFLRGTFHLFARDVLDQVFAPSLLSGAGAEMDLVGDIHTENYGTYKAADGKVHYDINDFDETTRGRLDFDVCRLATSLFLASRERDDSLSDAIAVTLAGLTTYTEAVRRFLKKGADYDVSEGSPCDCPSLDDLVRVNAANKRTEYIAKITEMQQGSRKLLRSLQFFNLHDNEREQALRLLADYIPRMPAPAFEDYYKVEDVCGRVAGIGSMGRLRYVILLAGKGTKEARNVLLEFKEARPSAYDLYRDRDKDPQALATRAERVINMQRQSQAASNPHLGFALDGGMSFQAREIGPHDTRLEVKTLKNTGKLERVAVVMATILARTHARAAARVIGAANPLAELNDATTFCQCVLAFALAYADLVQRDWSNFLGQRAALEKCEQWAT